jgi:hypothetical protein
MIKIVEEKKYKGIIRSWKGMEGGGLREEIEDHVARANKTFEFVFYFLTPTLELLFLCLFWKKLSCKYLLLMQ